MFIAPNIPVKLEKVLIALNAYKIATIDVHVCLILHVSLSSTYFV